jgi:hypothetical protein
MGGGGVAVGADLDEGSEAAGEQPAATTSTKIVTSSQRAFCTFIRVSLPDADRSEATHKRTGTPETLDLLLEVGQRIPPPAD